MLLAKLDSAGRHASKACASPPTMTSSSPASAAGSPRVIGMSSSTMPLPARRRASRCMVRGATVEAMPTISPGRAAAAIPSGASSTASASLSKPTTTITKSLRCATARGSAATVTPRFGLTARGLVDDRSPSPRTRPCADGAPSADPILPSPTMPTRRTTLRSCSGLSRRWSSPPKALRPGTFYGVTGRSRRIARRQGALPQQAPRTPGAYCRCCCSMRIMPRAGAKSDTAVAETELS